MIHEAMFYEKLAESEVKCSLCAIGAGSNPENGASVG